MNVVPPKLQPGSSVRAVAPSRSMVIIRTEVRELANRRLGALGLQLSFGDHVEVTDDFSSSPVEARLA